MYSSNSYNTSYSIFSRRMHIYVLKLTVTGKHLVLMTDTENPNDQYAFDNPCFRGKQSVGSAMLQSSESYLFDTFSLAEAAPVKHNIQNEKNVTKLEKNRWLGWSPLHSFGVQKNEKLTSLDDSYVKVRKLR